MNAPCGVGRSTNSAAEPAQPDRRACPAAPCSRATPGRSGQVQAGAGGGRARRDPGPHGQQRRGPRRGRSPSSSPVAGSAQMPPGARSPLLTTGDAGSGLPGAGRPSVSMRSSLPASEVGEAAAARLPPSPGGHEQRAVGLDADRAAVAGARRAGCRSAPVLGDSPGAMRTHRVAAGGGGVGVDELVLGVGRGEHERRSARRRRSRPPGRWPPSPGLVGRDPQDAAGGALGDERRRPAGQHHATADTGARHVATTCGSGSTHGRRHRAARRTVGAGVRLAGLGQRRLRAPAGPPSVAGCSRHGRGPASGNCAQPASRATSTSSAASDRPPHTRPDHAAAQ